VTEFAKLFPTLTFSAIALGVIAYVLMYPDRAQKVAGFIWAGIARVFGAADRKAVAHLVQGDVNTARAELMKDAPEGVLDSKLKVKWTKPEDAQALMREGDVVVFMKKARHREENLANAVMAYLPRAVLPRARRYIDRETMRAVDLTLARSILQVSHMPTGVLDVFFEKHLDPVLAEESGLRERLDEVDAIDIHGWLTRVMLNEYRIMARRAILLRLARQARPPQAVRLHHAAEVPWPVPERRDRLRGAERPRRDGGDRALPEEGEAPGLPGAVRFRVSHGSRPEHPLREGAPRHARD
jgi:hypothetical protein